MGGNHDVVLGAVVALPGLVGSRRPELQWPHQQDDAADKCRDPAGNAPAKALTAVGLSGRWERRMFGQHTGDGYVAGMEPEVLPGLVGMFPGRSAASLV